MGYLSLPHFGIGRPRNHNLRVDHRWHFPFSVSIPHVLRPLISLLHELYTETFESLLHLPATHSSLACHILIPGLPQMEQNLQRSRGLRTADVLSILNTTLSHDQQAGSQP